MLKSQSLQGVSEGAMGGRSGKNACFVLICLLVNLSGCAKETLQQPQPGEHQQDRSSSNATLQPTPALEQMIEETALNDPPAPSTSSADILGFVVADSDAGNVPDSPLANQLVLIMTLETAERLFGAGANLRFTQMDVPLDDAQITTFITGADGTFSAVVPPGEMALCLADEFSDGVATTRGCGQFTANPGPNTFTVSVGYGEILLDTD